MICPNMAKEPHVPIYKAENIHKRLLSKEATCHGNMSKKSTQQAMAV